MPDEAFDQDAWLTRIGYDGPRAPTLETLQALIAAHSRAIAYESIDVLLDRPPKLDLASLQGKMIAGQRGGYCFEQNILFRAGLRSLGYEVTSLQARVVRGLEIDAPRPMLHIVLCVPPFRCRNAIATRSITSTSRPVSSRKTPAWESDARGIW